MPSNSPDLADLYKGADFELEQFVKLILTELVSKMEVDGSDFYHNEYNDYGVITVLHFVPGNAHDMAGPEVFAEFSNGYRGTGRYQLNEKFVEHLMQQCFGESQ